MKRASPLDKRGFGGVLNAGGNPPRRCATAVAEHHPSVGGDFQRRLMISRTILPSGTGRVCVLLPVFLAALTTSCQHRTASVYDILIAGGEGYDGSGGAPVRADVAVLGDKIAKIGPVERSLARRVVDAS